MVIIIEGWETTPLQFLLVKEVKKVNNNKNLPSGIKLAIKTAKDVLILDKKISVVGLAGKVESIYYISFCTPNFRKTSKDLFKIIYYSKSGLIKFEETCYGDDVIKRLSQIKKGIIDLRALWEEGD